MRRHDERHGERGFTMVELMISGTLMLLLMLAVLSVLYKASDMAYVMAQRVALNAEARLMFDLAGNGVVRGDLAGDSPDNRVAGFRGANKGSWNATNFQYESWYWNSTASVNDKKKHTIQPDFNHFKLGMDHKNQNVTAWSSDSKELITCTGSGAPHPDCGSDTDTHRLGSLFNRNSTNNPVVQTGVIANTTVDLKFQLVAPRHMATTTSGGNELYDYLNETVFRSILSDLKESYRTSFYMPVDY